MLKIIGKAKNGWFVIGNVYKFHETNGLPINIIIDYLYDNKLLVAMDDLFFDAIKAGANPKSAKAKIHAAMSDSIKIKFKKKHYDWFDQFEDIK